jgi:hypothetical protein
MNWLLGVASSLLVWVTLSSLLAHDSRRQVGAESLMTSIHPAHPWSRRVKAGSVAGDGSVYRYGMITRPFRSRLNSSLPSPGVA